MSRPALGRLVGVLAAGAAVLVALAGSDWPPPRGFAFVVATAGLLGVVTALLVPRLLALADRKGRLRALLAALAAGAVIGGGVGLGFAAIGPGEPSAPVPGPAEVATFAVVVAAAGMLGAAVIAVTALALDRLSRGGPSPAGG